MPLGQRTYPPAKPMPQPALASRVALDFLVRHSAIICASVFPPVLPVRIRDKASR